MATGKGNHHGRIFVLTGSPYPFVSSFRPSSKRPRQILERLASGESCVIGLPGNLASAIVASTLFAKPLIRKLAGYNTPANEVFQAVTDSPLPANGARETYLRAHVSFRDETQEMPIVTPYHSQDSSLLMPLASCRTLIRRSINAPKVASWGQVEIIRLSNFKG